MKWNKEALSYRPGRLDGNPPNIKWIAERLGNGLLVDVGANVGVFSIETLCKCPGARAVAFEPQSKIADVMESLIALNEVDVELHRVALGSESGSAVLKMERRRARSGHATTGDYPAFEVHERETVRVTALDDWWRGAGCPSVRVVKVDVEGAEVDVLRGGMETLATVPYLFIERGEQQLAQHGQSVKALMNTLHELGYTCRRFRQNLCCERK
jgi:FkbM family methyltransferase